MKKTFKFLKYFFYFEKTRYYSGGALRQPVKITQKFSDEMKERKERFDKQSKDGWNRGGDTNYGSQTADLGNRPLVPDYIVEIRGNILFITGLLGWSFVIAIIIKEIFK